MRRSVGTTTAMIAATLGVACPSMAQFEEVAALRPADLEADDAFGDVMSLLGDRLLIGAPGADGVPGSGDEDGAAYLFDVGSRTLVARLADTGFGAREDYGVAVALSSSVAAVGAPNGSLGRSAGIVFFYDARNGDLLDLYQPSSVDDTDAFGTSIDIEGDVAVIGAIGADGAQAGSGAAFVVDLTDPTNPQELSVLAPSDTRFPDNAGAAVAIDGDLVLVGAPNRGSVGAAYLFDISDPAMPVELAKLTPTDGQVAQDFGFAVALEDGVAVVGSPRRDEGGMSNVGAAYLFDVSDPMNPVEVQKLLNPAGQESDRLGGSVAVNGNVAVVGIEDTTATISGTVLAFDATSGVLIGEALPDTPAGDDLYGNAITMDGDRLVVGAVGDDARATDAGAAYLFAFTGACRADLDGDGTLTIFDFLAFQNLFATGDPIADFDGDGALTLFDFLAFQNAFDDGC